jgi:hypothetical protein
MEMSHAGRAQSHGGGEAECPDSTRHREPGAQAAALNPWKKHGRSLRETVRGEMKVGQAVSNQSEFRAAPGAGLEVLLGRRAFCLRAEEAGLLLERLCFNLGARSVSEQVEELGFSQMGVHTFSFPAVPAA